MKNKVLNKFIFKNFKNINTKIKRIYFNTLPSTQLYARQNWENILNLIENEKWASIITEEQTTGIGQLNRKWHSPKDKNIYFTMLIPIKKQPDYINILPLYTANILCDTLSYFAKEYNKDINPKIKWVNDIFIEDKKLCGILIETIIQDNIMNLLLGVGINVNMNKEDFVKIDQPVTSLKEIININRNLDKLYIYNLIEDNLEKNLILLFENKLNNDEVINKINNKLRFIGKEIKIIDKYDKNKIIVEGEFIGINNDACCIIKESNGNFMMLREGRMILKN
jgi:BirA family biotin operon repressor/biotin-[acetyl-CoA-carboxylase] ligase